jgi:polar amino acid transport system substrate-binding protein
MKKLVWILIIVFAALFPVSAHEAFVLARPDGPYSDIAEQVLKEAYQRIGIEAQTQTFPSERSLATSNSGLVAGEVARLTGLERTYPNLIMVPVILNRIEVVAFVKNVTFKVQGWESLRPYAIGIRRGIKYAEQGTKAMNVEPVTSYEQCFKMLDSGRIDVVVTNLYVGLKTIKDLQLKGVRPLAPPLMAARNQYHYLHKKHADLVPKITKVLKEMEAEGRIKAIREQYFAQHLN